MIDIENYVFTQISDAVHAEYPDAVVIGDYIEELAKFPTVIVNEIGNATLGRMQDDENVEHYARVTYEVNVYSNERLDKKAVCKDVLNIVDGVMFGMKFNKTLTRRLPAINRTVYRLYARYTAVVDEGTEIDEGETVRYQIYRG